MRECAKWMRMAIEAALSDAPTNWFGSCEVALHYPLRLVLVIGVMHIGHLQHQDKVIVCTIMVSAEQHHSIQDIQGSIWSRDVLPAPKKASQVLRLGAEQ